MEINENEDIVFLARLIASETEKIAAHLSQNDRAFPSFGVDGPATSQISPGATDIETARLAVIDATQRLRSLILGPRDYLLSFQANDLLGLHFIARYKLASKVPIHGYATYEQLAKATAASSHSESSNAIDDPSTNNKAVPASVVRRLLRQAVLKNVFRETPDGKGVMHTAASRLLADDSVLSDLMGYSLDEKWLTAAKTLDAIAKWPDCENPEQTGFSLAMETNRAMYTFYEGDPKRGQRFANAMALYARSPGFAVDHLVSGYDWAALGSGTVVDIGGSQGTIVRRIAASFPNLKFIVQDLEPVVNQARAAAAAAAAAGDPNESRISFMPHDFFNTQPVTADVYLLRWILHNWSDKYCVRMLRALIPALKPGAKIVVNEDVRPAFGSAIPSMWQEEKMRAADLTMLHNFNGKERDLQEWKDLFESADPRFRVNGVNKSPGSALSVLEAIWIE